MEIQMNTLSLNLIGYLWNNAICGKLGICQFFDLFTYLGIKTIHEIHITWKMMIWSFSNIFFNFFFRFKSKISKLKITFDCNSGDIGVLVLSLIYTWKIERRICGLSKIWWIFYGTIFLLLDLENSIKLWSVMKTVTLTTPNKWGFYEYQNKVTEDYAENASETAGFWD